MRPLTRLRGADGVEALGAIAPGLTLFVWWGRGQGPLGGRNLAMQPLCCNEKRREIRTGQPVRRAATCPDTNEAPWGTATIRPFTFEATDADLEDLRPRIVAARWPEKETVADQSQGVQLASIRGSLATGRRTTTGASARRS